MKGANKKVDVLIVGAGPAGTSAGYDLARRGFSVLIVDQYDFPRKKICAGAITKKTIMQLKYPVSSVVRLNTNEFLMRHVKEENIKPIPLQKNMLAMTCRYELDHYMLKKAMNKNSEFLVVYGKLKITLDSQYTILEWDNITVSAAWVIAADGANSRLKRLLSPNLSDAKNCAFAMEGDVTLNGNERELVTRMDFGWLKGGYAWAFVKDDHVNLGIYVLNRNNKREGFGKVTLHDYVASLGLSEPQKIVGAAIGTKSEVKLTAGRVLFVGDAAEVADPIWGEGIYAAVYSGQMAARAVADFFEQSAGKEYERLMRSFIFKRKLSGFFAWLLYKKTNFMLPVFRFKMKRDIKKDSA